MENREIGGIWFISGHWPLDPDKPTLIFIHGAALSGIFWEPQITSLKDVANTVAVDLLQSKAMLKNFGRSLKHVQNADPMLFWVTL